MWEEVDLIVESILGVLLRTLLEISNRPQTPASTMRPQSHDVTVSELRPNKGFSKIQTAHVRKVLEF